MFQVPEAKHTVVHSLCGAFALCISTFPGFEVNALHIFLPSVSYFYSPSSFLIANRKVSIMKLGCKGRPVFPSNVFPWAPTCIAMINNMNSK